MTKKELTKIEALEMAIQIIKKTDPNPEELLEKLEAMQTQEEKTREKAKNRKNVQSKVAKENKIVAEMIEAFFEEAADKEIAYTTDEIAEYVETGLNTPQKMTAVMKYVTNATRVDKATNEKTRVGYKYQAKI